MEMGIIAIKQRSYATLWLFCGGTLSQGRQKTRSGDRPYPGYTFQYQPGSEFIHDDRAQKLLTL
jgi:hypothetical protein